MAKLPTHKEHIHHEFFDTLIRGTGTSTIANTTRLFRALNIGNPALTNMQEGGRLSNEEVFLTISIRIYVQFATAATYRWMEDGIIWTYQVGHKQMLESLPLFCAPGGGGLFGHDVNAQGHVITNGTPDWSGILKFAKPVKIERNQNFFISMEFATFPSLDAGVTAAINPLTNLNVDTGLKIIKAFVGGIVQRDVQ
jgi:hypothetical protein